MEVVKRKWTVGRDKTAREVGVWRRKLYKGFRETLSRLFRISR